MELDERTLNELMDLLKRIAVALEKVDHPQGKDKDKEVRYAKGSLATTRPIRSTADHAQERANLSVERMRLAERLEWLDAVLADLDT